MENQIETEKNIDNKEYNTESIENFGESDYSIDFLENLQNRYKHLNRILHIQDMTVAN